MMDMEGLEQYFVFAERFRGILSTGVTWFSACGIFWWHSGSTYTGS